MNVEIGSNTKIDDKAIDEFCQVPDPAGEIVDVAPSASPLPFTRDEQDRMDRLDDIETVCRLVCADKQCTYCDIIENGRMRCILKRVAIGKDGICLSRIIRK